jgi:hypothetical protein
VFFKVFYLIAIKLKTQYCARRPPIHADLTSFPLVQRHQLDIDKRKEKNSQKIPEKKLRKNCYKMHTKNAARTHTHTLISVIFFPPSPSIRK